MTCLNKNRMMRASLSVFVAMYLGGCGGGMIGTGTGPSTETVETYQLRSLPNRISPDIPKTLLKGDEITPTEPDSLDVSEEKWVFSSRMNDINSGKSSGWLGINEELVLADLIRVNTEINATIIDLAFDDILMQCVSQLIDCVIPGDQIKVKLTQSVINRLIERVTDWAKSLPPQIWNEDVRGDVAPILKEQFSSLLDSEVMLGETHYSQLDGAPYTHSVRTLLTRMTTLDEEFTFLLWRGEEEFSARWHNDGSVAKFETKSAALPVREYFYKNNNPSEFVVANSVFPAGEASRSDQYTKVTASDPGRSGVLVEAASNISQLSNAESQTVENYRLIQGQMDSAGGYLTFDGTLFDSTDTRNLVAYRGFRDSFNNVGDLIAGKTCVVTYDPQGIEVCDEESFEPSGAVGSSITDSPYYFQSADFDSLAAIQDVTRWTVEGLPVEVKGFAVVPSGSALDPTEREMLCRGFQIFSDDTHVFCSATDEQLDNTIVLELVDGKLGRIIPTANLVQIP